jgi:hypothetical protein
MVENLDLVGEESFVAIGANGKWQRRRREFRRRWFAYAQGSNRHADGERGSGARAKILLA